MLALLATIQWTAVTGPAVALFGVAIMGFLYMKSNAAKVWRDTSEGWKARAEQLEKANEGYIVRIAQLEAKVAELERRPDLEVLSKGLASLGDKLDTLVAGQDSAVSAVVDAADKLRAETKDAAVRLRDPEHPLPVQETPPLPNGD